MSPISEHTIIRSFHSFFPTAFPHLCSGRCFFTGRLVATPAAVCFQLTSPQRLLYACDSGSTAALLVIQGLSSAAIAACVPRNVVTSFPHSYLSPLSEQPSRWITTCKCCCFLTIGASPQCSSATAGPLAGSSPLPFLAAIARTPRISSRPASPYPSQWQPQSSPHPHASPFQPVSL